MKHRSPQFLNLLRRLGRPSTVARGLWLAVAALHAWLVLRRVALGEWGDALGILRGGLCLLGMGYASLKLWRVALVFDSAPRRAFIFGLILLLGHWLLATPGQPGAGLFDAPGTAPIVAVLLLAPAAGFALLLKRIQSGSRPRAPRRTSIFSSIKVFYTLERRPLTLLRQASFYFHRPPPQLA